MLRKRKATNGKAWQSTETATQRNDGTRRDRAKKRIEEMGVALISDGGAMRRVEKPGFDRAENGHETRRRMRRHTKEG